MIDMEHSDFKTVLDLAQQILQMVQMPLFASKHSRKTFTNHQLFKLMVIKSFLGLDYRRFEDHLKTSKIPEYLGMDRVPHFTTFQKFAKRQSTKNLEKLLLKFVKLQNNKLKNVGFDATGFTLSHASKHYEKRIGKTYSKKDFMKANLFFDLNNLMILGIKMRKKSRHDLLDLPSMLNKINHLDFKYVYADKAYDAEWLHKMIFETGSVSKIHLKNEKVPVHRTSGDYRKHMKRRQKNSEKGIRSLCETVNSMLKRIFGSVIRARIWFTQKIELLFKIIAFNLERLCKITKKFFALILFFLDFLDFFAKNELVKQNL
jgi:hypothetical protein